MDIIQYNKVLKGHNGRIVTQFRLGLSPLRNELFTYNITENPFCPTCGDHVETLSHFLFTCVSYSAQRIIFMNDINSLINAVNISSNLSLVFTDLTVLTHLITHGVYLPMADSDTNYLVNSRLFNIVSKYISSTSRFKNIS